MRRSLAVLALAALAASGCALRDGQSDRLLVVASVYPLAFAAEKVGGDDVDVVNLTRPGAEPHDVELTPQQVSAVRGAGLVVYLGSGFQPEVEAAVGGLGSRALDILEVPEIARRALEAEPGDPAGEPDDHAGEVIDPHIWLDPDLMALVADAIAISLSDLDTDRASIFQQRAAAFAADLSILDDEYERGLADCERREFVTTHAAFGYLATRYDLDQVGITGVSPEAEPSPRRLAEVAEFARDHGATTIFFERLASPRVAEALARELGVGTGVLDPIEGPPPEGDYLDAMRANLEALRRALDCR